jgi:hypothetical protein
VVALFALVAHAAAGGTKPTCPTAFLTSKLESATSSCKMVDQKEKEALPVIEGLEEDDEFEVYKL